MENTKETFFTAIGCMDGRIQEVVASFGCETFGVKYADTITEAGFVGILARRALDQEFMDGFCKKLFISINEHQSKGVLIHAHENCAGNPITNDQQKEQLKGAIEFISFLVTPTVVRGIFLARLNKDSVDWFIEEIH